METKEDNELKNAGPLAKFIDPLAITMGQQLDYKDTVNLAATCHFFNKHKAVKKNIHDKQPSPLIINYQHAFIFHQNRLFFKGDITCNKSLSSDHFVEHNITQFKGIKIKKIATGQHFIFILLVTGELFAKGDNFYGQLGLGTDKTNTDVNQDFLPIKPRIPTGSKIIDIVLGNHCSFITLNTGQIFATGDNRYGQLGLPFHASYAAFCAVPIPTNSNIIQIATMGERSFLLTEEGELWGSGEASYHRLGLPNNTKQLGFIKIRPELPPNTRIKKVICGEYNTFLQLDNNQIVAFGNNKHGEFGSEDTKSIFNTLPFYPAEDRFIKDIKVSDASVLILLDNGQLFVAGQLYGERFYQKQEIEHSNNTQISGFREITPLFPNGEKIIQLGRGRHCTYLLLNNDDIWGCGHMDGLLDKPLARITSLKELLDMQSPASCQLF